MRILATDRDAAVDQSAQLTRELDDSRARAERLRAQVRTLVSPQQSVQGMSERMRSMLRMAEDEVAEMLQRADNEVTQEPARRRAEGGGHRRGGARGGRRHPHAVQGRGRGRRGSGHAAARRAGGGGERAPRAARGRPGDGRAGDRRGARPPGRRAEGARRGRHPRRCRRRPQALRRVDGVGEPAPSGGGGLPHRDGPTPQGSAHRAHGRAARHAHGHRGDARARARRGQADGRGRAGRKRPGSWPTPGRPWVRLREQRQRIVGQLAASRADLDQLVTALGPLPGEQDSEQATPPSGSPVVQPSPAFTPTPHPR